MKGFLLLGALCVLSLAFLVEEASPQSTTSPSSTVTTENPTSPSVTITTENSTAPSTPDSTINSTAPATRVTPNKDTSTSTNPPVSNKCNDTSCGGDAVCVPLFDSIACQCPVRFFYEDQSCKEGGSVLGKLIIQDRDFDQDTESEAYTALYQEIQNFFTKSLGQQYNGTYVETVIENITAVSSTSRALTPVVTALVTNMFNTLSINLIEINEFIKNKVAGETFSYSSRSICEVASCDLKTTACIETQNGQNTDCSCLGGHYRESNTACKNCNDHCAANTNQQCVWSTETSEEKCQCLPGYTTNKDGGSCKECDFGYSGNDCKDNFLLILVIVGSVAGGVIIALVGAVIGISVRSSRKRKDYERTELLGNDDKISGGASPMTGHLFPKVRAKPDIGHVNRASNVYDDDQFSQSFPKRDYNEANEEPWYEMNQRERKY